MGIVDEAFKELFPDKAFPYETQLKYSRKFKAYNANVALRDQQLTFKLSREWKQVDRDIVKGLLQELLQKLFAKKHGWKRQVTRNMELYHLYIKNVALVAPKTQFDTLLGESFNRVNQQYFYETLEVPNLMFGQVSYTKLGSYEYGSDTITISQALKDAPLEILDYIMYHEMLHKKLKYTCTNGRSQHHSPAFKKLEKAYIIADIEEKLTLYLRSHKTKTKRQEPRIPIGLRTLQRFFA